jgi:hypothetical protein
VGEEQDSGVRSQKPGLRMESICPLLSADCVLRWRGVRDAARLYSPAFVMRRFCS